MLGRSRSYYNGIVRDSKIILHIQLVPGLLGNQLPQLNNHSHSGGLYEDKEGNPEGLALATIPVSLPSIPSQQTSQYHVLPITDHPETVPCSGGKDHGIIES